MYANIKLLEQLEFVNFFRTVLKKADKFFYFFKIQNLNFKVP